MTEASSSAPPYYSISISDTFDGGNAKLVAVTYDAEVTNVILHIQPDVYTELEQMSHMQYFCFRSTLSKNSANGATAATPKKQLVRYTIHNADKVSYPEAWPGTTVCYSTSLNDVDSWKRCLDTAYTDGKLTWEFEHDDDSHGLCVYFAFFPPFSYERHLSLVSQCAAAKTAAANANQQVQVYSLGQTLRGREMDCIQVGTGSTVCWIIHRQHPGETMAEHYAEGLLQRLLQLNGQATTTVEDETRDTVLQKYTFYIVPCMCPDGAVMGHLRTNSVGANLNREWANRGHYQAPTALRSPEVLSVLTKMDETGVDLFLDIHGDEELPFNFLSGAEKVPKWGPRLQALHGAFCAAYCRADSNMQSRIGYPPAEHVKEVLSYMNVATNQVSNRFDCLGLTLEMPFKDCRSNPDPEIGWSPAKCRALGASVLEPVLYIHNHLRAGCHKDDTKVDWTKRFGPADAYVKTTDDYQSEPGFERKDGFLMLHRRLYSDVHEINKPK